MLLVFGMPLKSTSAPLNYDLKGGIFSGSVVPQKHSFARYTFGVYVGPFKPLSKDTCSMVWTGRSPVPSIVVCLPMGGLMQYGEMFPNRIGLKKAHQISIV